MRLARSQRNHIALALRTWACLKRLASQARTTGYQLKQGLLDDYLRHELAQPTLPFAYVLVMISLAFRHRHITSNNI